MRMAVALIVVAVIGQIGAAQPPSLTPEERQLDARARELIREGSKLYQQGKVTDAVPKFQEVVELWRKLYPQSRYPDGHPLIADSLSNLGFMLEAAGSRQKAILPLEEALAMQRRLYPASKSPKGHPHLANTLNNLGLTWQRAGRPDKAATLLDEFATMLRKLYPESNYPGGTDDLLRILDNVSLLLKEQGAYERARPHLEQALAVRRKMYPESSHPDGHARLAGTLNNLGTVVSSMGAHEEAIPYLEQALAMQHRLYPATKYSAGHLELATSINNLGVVWQKMGHFDKAIQRSEEALAMFLSLYPAAKYPDGHFYLAHALINLGFLQRSIGSSEKALACFEQALAMTQKLSSTYPQGPLDLVLAVSNMGSLLEAMGLHEKALPHAERALALVQQIYPPDKYPNGHPHLANCLITLGNVQLAMGEPTKARSNFEQALTMGRNLWPASNYRAGHPDLSNSLNNLGALLRTQGDFEQARPYLEEALAMTQRLYPAARYPDGHPDLANRLASLGLLFEEMGAKDKALGYYEQALGTQIKLGRRMSATASETEALAFVQWQAPVCDALLALTRDRPETAARAYAAVWSNKSAVTRVLSLRHAALRANGAGLTAQLDQLRARRRRIDQLLQDRRLPPQERDQLLAAASDERDRLERELARVVPEFGRTRELDALGPDDLAKLLPEGAVLIDFVRYLRFKPDRAPAGSSRNLPTPAYTAFVFGRSPKASVKRVELGDAKAIDAVVQSWRTSIEDRRDTRGFAEGTLEGLQPAAGAAHELRQLVWTKLAAAFPPGTKTLYLATDGALARLPWAALPTGDRRLLVEEFSVATVPHGPFLLEQLRFRRDDDRPSKALALGDVAYNSPLWPALPGTRAELAGLQPMSPVILTGADATSARLSAALSKAHWAHLATHGFFDERAFEAERNRATAAVNNWQFAAANAPRQVASKNPLSFVGLVLSNGEIFSGLSILDLSLEQLKLATLSACETGLGAFTDGEGVFGLQRAFHLAGCPNVVASLWKVNDAATAALMAKFYHELWVNKRAPIEALREAQLTIYHHPELIPDLAGERGAPKLKEAVAVKGEPSRVSGRILSPTKLWAAFVLSGVGR